MKSKKLLSIGLPILFVSAGLVSTSVALVSCSEKIEYKTLDLESLTEENLVNGKLIISKNINNLTGRVPENLRNKISSVEFDENAPIETIPEKAFCYCEHLVSVKFPKTLKEIKMFAFTNTAITNVDLSMCTNLESIGTMSFINMASWGKGNLKPTIESVVFPSGLKNIYSGAFANQTKIQTLNIPNSVNTISYQPKGEQPSIYGAFQGCTGLTSVQFIETGSVPLAIGQYTFSGCTGLSSQTMTLPPRLKEISGNAFQGISNLTLNITNTSAEGLNLIPRCFTGATSLTINVKNKDIKTLVTKALAGVDHATINIVS